MIKPGTMKDQSGHVVDIVPTFLDILKLQYPDSINGYSIIPLHGSSLLHVFKEIERREPDYFISGLGKFRMFRSGDSKIVRLNGGEWELYNIKVDPTELNNLATAFPDKLNELLNLYSELE